MRGIAVCMVLAAVACAPEPMQEPERPPIRTEMGDCKPVVELVEIRELRRQVWRELRRTAYELDLDAVVVLSVVRDQHGLNEYIVTAVGVNCPGSSPEVS